MGSSAVRVAIVGTGYADSHPDAAVNYRSDLGWDFVNGDSDPFDDNGNGTHILGSIAAATNNALQIAGIAPQIEIFAVKVLSASGSGTVTQVASGIDWARAQGADILVMPFGASVDIFEIRQAVLACEAAGILMLSIAGNDDSSSIIYPAAYQEVIAVGSVDEQLNRSFFSNRGPQLELMAPGENILSTVPPGGTASYSGTSMATAQAAGVAALVMSKLRSFGQPGTASVVRQILIDTAQDLGAAGWDTSTGWGLVRADLALANVVTATPAAGREGLGLRRVGVLGRSALRFAAKSPEQDAELRVFDLRGRLLGEALFVPRGADWVEAEPRIGRLARGVYVARLTAGEAKLELKFMVR